MAYTKEAKKHQRDLILNATKAERFAIKYFDYININYRFQKIIKVGDKYYIADFYFPRLKTILEIDGEYHNDEKQIVRDKKREDDLKSKGYKVVRMSNDDVFNHNFPMRELIKTKYKKNEKLND